MIKPCRGSLACLLVLATARAAAAQNAGLEAEARTLLDQGRAAEAVRTIEQNATAAERDADLWFVLALGYHTLLDDAGLLKKRGLAKKMKLALESSLDLEPDHVDARRELADFYYYAPWIVGGDKGKATEQLDLLEAVAPAAAFTARGEYARNAGDLNVAREHYLAALEVGPRTTTVVFALATIEQDLGAYAESIQLLDEVIETEPDNPEAYYYRARAAALGAIDLDRGLESVAQFLERCDECDDSDRGFGWWRRAMLLEHTGKLEAAIAAYRQALRLNPDLEGARARLEELQ